MKRKICFVFTSPIVVEFFLSEHLRFLENDYDIYLATNTRIDQDVLEHYQGVKHIENIRIERKIRPLYDLVTFFKLILFFHKNQFDIVQTITPKAGLLGQIAACVAGVENRVHIFTGQVWANYKGFKLLLFKTIDRIIGNLTSYNLVDGNSQKKFLLENKILSKALVLGNGSICGVNSKDFHHDDIVREKVRRRMRLDKEAIVLLFLGRLSEDKGVNDLIKAFKLVKESVPNLMLVLAGPSEMKLDIDDDRRIICTGYLSKEKGEVQEILQAADIFCIPSYREGFGVSVLEASAMGKPVICSDIYGLKDAFIDQVTGIMFKKGNVSDLVEKILTLANNEEKRIALGENGRSYAINFYDSKRIVEAYGRFYARILSRKSQKRKSQLFIN